MSYLVFAAGLSLLLLLINRIEDSAFAEEFFLGRVPALGDLRDRKQLDRLEHVRVLRQFLLVAGSIEMLRDDLLSFGSVEELEVGFGGAPRPLAIHIGIDDRHMRLGPN